MRIRYKVLLLAWVSGFILLVAFWFYIGRPPNSSLTFRENAPLATPAVQPATAQPSAPSEAPPSRQEQENAMTKFLNTMKDSLKKAGIQETSAVTEQLRKAVASKDHGEIVRAFHEAIYGHYQKMSKVLPAVKAHLADADPFVRLTAARTLYTAGDRSGFETLSDFVTAKEVIPDGKQDLRLEAARVLAKFREREAGPNIRELYSQTKAGGLLTSLATLGMRATEASSWPFVNSDLALQRVLAALEGF